MNITLTQSDIKRIIKDTLQILEELERNLSRASHDDKADIIVEITERRELVQYLNYNVKLNARDGKK